MIVFHAAVRCLLWAGIVAAVPGQHWTSTVEVKANTGTYTGFVNDTAPNVRQFLNIPFSLPPTGERRWLPPVAVPNSANTKIDATKFPPSCPQYAPKTPSTFSAAVPEFVAVVTPQDQIAKTSEDCLSLAIWTPTGKKSGLPVIMFMTGGGWRVGGIDIGYQLPYHWVQRTQSHIVITINYRVNIFGFPHASGLSDQNLGILDQRMALEWVRDNIQAFGGDPSRITLWGQSAGAGSVDVHNFAFHSDPIARSFVMNSGSVFLISNVTDTTHKNFTYVASQLGCKDLSPTGELACMRKIPYQDILNFIGRYADNGTTPALSFLPTPDEKIVFANYRERYARGLLSPGPAIFTNVANEGASLVPYPPHPFIAGPNQTTVNQVTLGLFLCPASVSTSLRSSAGRKTYRWQFAGNFTNVSPRFWLGAYHSSDLAFTMGTHQDFRGPSTSFEYGVSDSMQDYLLAFMVDPENGPAKLGWQDSSSGNMLRFGADGKVVQTVSEASVDAACSGAPYNPSP